MFGTSKNLLFISFFIFYPLILKAQNLPSPNICKVNVNTDSTVTIFWQYPDTIDFDGFIIKRIIYDGDGVINGTLNNIQIISNRNVRLYTDTSTQYNTHTKPFLRPETYVISAFKKQNNVILYSNMSAPHNTIFLNCVWDTCSQKLALHWTEYSNRQIDEYQIFFSENFSNFNLLTKTSPSVTSINFSNIKPNTNYKFFIKAILTNNTTCITDTSYSNFINIFTYTPLPPDTLLNIKVSTIANDSIFLSFKTSGGQGIKKFTLKKIDNDTSIICNFSPNEKLLNYTDNCYDKKVYKYYIETKTICPEIIKNSSIVSNSVLTAETNNKKFVLNWTKTKILEKQPKFIEIYIQLENKNWEKIKTLQGEANTTIINFDEIFPYYNIENISKIKFKIKFIYETENSYSNSVEVSMTPIILIPNTILPNSDIEENQHFTIKTAFIKNFKITIFDTSGGIIFKSNKNVPWDAHLPNGKLAPQGTYIYNIQYSDYNNKVYFKKGFLNVIY